MRVGRKQLEQLSVFVAHTNGANARTRRRPVHLLQTRSSYKKLVKSYSSPQLKKGFHKQRSVDTAFIFLAGKIG